MTLLNIVVVLLARYQKVPDYIIINILKIENEQIKSRGGGVQIHPPTDYGG